MASTVDMLDLCMQVPQLVVAKLKPAAAVQEGLLKAAAAAGETGRVMAWWNPDSGEVQLSLGKDVHKSRYMAWDSEIRKLAAEVPNLITGVSYHYPTPEDTSASIWLLKDHNQMEDIYKAAAYRIAPAYDAPGGPLSYLLQEFEKCGAAAEALQASYLFDAAYAPLAGHEKRAANFFGQMYNWAGAPFGGPTPFSNAIVTSLLGAGLGNVAGWALSKILPDRYINTDRLWRLLAIAGALSGPLIHGAQAYGNMQLNGQATGKPHIFRSIFMPAQKQQMPADYYNRRGLDLNDPKQLRRKVPGVKQSTPTSAPAPPQPNKKPNPVKNYNTGPGLVRNSNRYGRFGKLAEAGLTAMQPIPVDSFNRMIWNDAHKGVQSNRFSPYGQAGSQIHTPPQVAAVASSVVSGVSDMYGGASMLSPAHFMKGLVAAGVDGATAKVTGGILGALGVMRPEAQAKLQDMGVWGGLMRGVAGSMLGMK